jgi:ribosomal protein S18 acetylase RimI-like enzyme
MSPLFIRPARRSDCVDIARLVLMSSDGIAEYIWRPHVLGRFSLIAVGTQRCARDDVPFSWTNCLIAEQGGRIAGSLHAVAIPAPLDDEDTIDESDPVLRTLLEFSDRGSLEIRGLAVYPEFRGRGAATRLIAAAASQARAQGLARLSVICFATNEAAIRFYRGFGFAERARGAAPAHPAFDHTGGEMLLLTRSARQTAAERVLGDLPVAANAVSDTNGMRETGSGTPQTGATVVPIRTAVV